MRGDALVVGSHEHQTERQRGARRGDVEVDHVALHHLTAARAGGDLVLAGGHAPVAVVDSPRERRDGFELLSLADFPRLRADARVIAARAAGLPGHRRPPGEALAARLRTPAEETAKPLGDLQIGQTDGGSPAAEGDEAEREPRGERVPLAAVRRAVAAGIPPNLRQ